MTRPRTRKHIQVNTTVVAIAPDDVDRLYDVPAQRSERNDP